MKFNELFHDEPLPLHPSDGEYYYRYSDYLVSGKQIVIALSLWRVTKHTTKGVRLEGGKLVIHAHNKKFACKTIADAKISYIARKRREYAIHSARAKHAEACLQEAQRGLNETSWQGLTIKLEPELF